MRCALYARVSTGKQAEKYGIPSQVEALKKRCRERDWEVVPDGEQRAFIDDGYSGSEMDRPALNRLREMVRRRLADVVMAYDPDRLSRKLFHQMLLAEEFEKHGVRLEFITQLLSLTRDQERMVRALVEGIRGSLDDPDFARKQQLLRLLVEKVCHQADAVEVHTVIPLGEQLPPLHREGARG